MTRHLCPLALGAAVLITSTACTSPPMGLGADQLQSQWSTPSSTTWSAVAAMPLDDPPSSPDGDVSAAFEELVQRRVACGRMPDECEVSRLAVPGSPMFDHLSELMAERIENGITASEEGSLRVQIESVEVPEPGRANVTTCLVDDTVLVVDEAVYDDSVYSARSRWTLVESNRTWLWSDEDVIEWVVEKDLCAED